MCRPCIRCIHNKINIRALLRFFRPWLQHAISSYYEWERKLHTGKNFRLFVHLQRKMFLGDRDRMWYATNWFSQITFTSSSSRQSLHIVPLIAQSPCLYVAAYKSVTRDQARRWRRRSKVFFLTPPSSWETDGAPRIILRPTHSCTTATCSYFSRGIRKYTRDILLDL